MPALVVGTDERILVANDGALQIFGQGITGRHYITILRQPQVLDAVEQVMAGAASATAPFVARDGARDETWRVSVGGLPQAGGRGALLSFEDTSAIENAEIMRREFVANVSHELRTPLTSLLGFIETLRGPARGDLKAQDRFLSIMQKEASRMSQLVSDLLSLSRVEENERSRPTETVDLAAVVLAACSALEPVARAAKVTISTNADERKSLVQGDHDQLRQVVTNVLENAIKYGRPETAVSVTLSAASHQPSLRAEGIMLVVQDQGEGIEPHHLPRLTERFYRIDRHRSREVGGTGLGLAIVKHIVNRHRGRLRIHSDLGQGTRVTIVLPAATEPHS